MLCVKSESSVVTSFLFDPDSLGKNTQKNTTWLTMIGQDAKDQNTVENYQFFLHYIIILLFWRTCDIILEKIDPKIGPISFSVNIIQLLSVRSKGNRSSLKKKHSKVRESWFFCLKKSEKLFLLKNHFLRAWMTLVLIDFGSGFSRTFEMRFE